MLAVTLPRSDGVRLAMHTAIVGTVFIAIGAFWLSFTSLTDLARRSGINSSQAWVWPLIVDGIIIVATVSAVALAGSRAAWYPWVLLTGGAAISVAANATHAIVADATNIPLLLAASVASVPPLVLLAITHLTSVLMRHVSGQTEQSAAASEGVDETKSLPLAVDGKLADAASLRALGWSNLAIAKRIGVHPSTVGRWLKDRVVAPSAQTNEITEVGTDG